MWAGLALTVVATVYPLIDRTTTHVLADHIRATYPSYGADKVEEGVTAYLVMLSILGGLGVLSWLGVMWASRTGKRWTSWAATGVFVVAVGLALAGLTVKDTSGYVGLAPALAWLQVPPCLVGLVTVVQLWHRPQWTPGPRGRGAADATLSILGAAKRALYRGGRPARLARWWNTLDAWVYSTGLLLPRHAAVLKVRGRRTGRPVSVPVAIADVDGTEYLVSMLGADANWVRNVEAAGGLATLRRRRRDIRVLLEKVPPEDRAPILSRYVAVAPGARPHLGLGPTATIAEFARIAGNHPVYRIRQHSTTAAETADRVTAPARPRTP